MQIWSTEIKELETLFISIKGQFPDLEKELEQLIDTKDANVVMLYSRRCLEIIVTDLCECELKRPRRTEPLKGIIDKLNHEEKVPAHIITSMHGLNDLATFGAHPKEFDPQQVRPVLINLTTIIKWYLKYKDSKTISDIKTEGGGDDIKSPFVSKEIIRKPKASLILLLSGILVVVAFIAYPKIFRQDRLEKLRSSDGKISIAVMPFQNMTNDTTWNVWQDGIQYNLITALSNAEELKIRQTESITGLLQSKGLTNYVSMTPSVASKISQKLEANVFIYGGINQAGSKMRLNAQLIDSKTKEILKSFQVEGPAKEENIFHIIDSLSMMVSNFLIISKIGKEVNPEMRHLASTSSPEAYRYFIYGSNAFMKRDYPNAIKLFSQAIAIDSNFTFATLSLAVANGNQGSYEEAKKWCLKAYKNKDQMPMWQKVWINWVYAIFLETPQEEIKYLKQLKEIDDQYSNPYSNLGYCYNVLHQYDKAIPEMETVLKMYNKWGSKPSWVYDYTLLGYAYHKTGQYKKEKKLYKKAEQDYPEDPDLISRQTILSLIEGDTIKANQYIKKYKSVIADKSSSKADLITGMASIYSEAGILDKAEKYYRQALLLEPENPVRLYNLSLFLIDKNRNTTEGLELIDEALELNPDSYYMLDTKGWGLYKQGKYKEALELLEKSWELKPIYDHEIFLHLEEVKKAITNQKNT
jgi:tetratricopeptide (TPR) repeat protein/TolB-like protein